MKLVAVRGEVIHSGVFPGLPNQQVPLWADSNNFVFKDNSAKIAAAHTPLFDQGGSAAGIGVLAVDNDGAAALIWGDEVGLYRGLASPTTVDVTRLSGPYTGTDSDLWSIVQFGQSILATNGVDPIQYMADVGVDANFIDITDPVSDLVAGFQAKILIKTGAFIMALNTDNDDSEYRWCSEDDVLTWSPLSSNSARDIQMRELNSDIVAAVEMGEFHVVFGRDQARLLAFIGAPFYFGDEHLISGIGAVGKHAVTAVGRLLYGFSSNGIWVMDGSSFQYIDDPAVHRYIYEINYDSDQAAKVVTWVDQNEAIVYFSFPTLTGGLTVGFNYHTSAWSLYDWFRTAATTGGLWGHPVMLDSNGLVWLQDPSLGAITSGGNPVQMQDLAWFGSYYGHGGYGRGAYNGRTWLGIDT